MLKVLATVNNRRTLFLGLERENTARLHDDKPIVLDLQAMTQSIEMAAPVQDIVILAGETLRDVYAQLLEVMPELPPYVEPEPDQPPWTYRKGSKR